MSDIPIPKPFFTPMMDSLGHVLTYCGFCLKEYQDKIIIHGAVKQACTVFHGIAVCEEHLEAVL